MHHLANQAAHVGELLARVLVGQAEELGVIGLLLLLGPLNFLSQPLHLLFSVVGITAQVPNVGTLLLLILQYLKLLVHDLLHLVLLTIHHLLTS